MTPESAGAILRGEKVTLSQEDLRLLVRIIAAGDFEYRSKMLARLVAGAGDRKRIYRPQQPR